MSKDAYSPILSGRNESDVDASSIAWHDVDSYETEHNYIVSGIYFLDVFTTRRKNFFSHYMIYLIRNTKKWNCEI